jgi:hypothetical protein
MIAGLFDTAFGNGLRGLASSGHRPGDEWHTEAAIVFRAACLPGLKKAQEAISTKVIELELQISQAAKDKAPKRGTKSTSDPKEALQNRQLVLRRLVDGMLWLLFWPKKWVLRRLRLEGGIKRVNVSQVRELLEAVAHQHAKNEETIWIICDLSTPVQLGDVIYARWTPGCSNMKLTVGELKVGPINRRLHELLHAPRSGDINLAVSKIACDLASGKGTQVQKERHLKEQLVRMARQEQRLKNFERVLRTDEGVDPMSWQPFRMTKNTHISKDYRDEIRELISRAKIDGFSEGHQPVRLQYESQRGDATPIVVSARRNARPANGQGQSLCTT